MTASTVRLLSVPAAAEELSCSDDHVYRLVACGQLRAVDIAIGGRTKTRIRSDDLQRYIDAHTRKTA